MDGVVVRERVPARLPTASAPSRTGRVAIAVLVVLLSWGPAIPGLVMAAGGAAQLEAIGTFSAALSFGGAAALLPLRGGHGGRGGPLLPLTLAVAGIGAGLSALASGLRTIGAGDGLWLDLLGVAWMPGCLTVASVLGAAMLTHSRILLATGAALSIGLAVTAVLELRRRSDLDIDIVLWVLWLALALGSALVLLWTTRLRRPPDCDAAGWLLLAQVTLLICGVGGFVVDSGGSSYLGTTIAAAFLPAALNFTAAAFLLAAIARAPTALDPAFARIAVGVLLVSALLAAYGAVATTAAQLAPITPASAGMIAVVALAVGAEPARRWVQRAVDQLLYGRSADPRALLRTVSEEIASGSDSGSLDALAEALRRSLRLGGVAIRSAAPGGPEAVAGVVAERSTQTVELVAADGPCGTVELSAGSARRVDHRTVAAVRRIGGVLSVAVRLAEINDDLIDARRRARQIAASERRFARAEIEARIEPALRGIREDLHAYPEAADPQALLARAGAALQAATTDVRDLARTLLPGSLDAGDLPGALGELAERFESPELEIVVGAHPDHPEAVYHLVAEAVLRARRRTGITRIDVTVNAADRWELTLSGDEEQIAQVREALSERVAETGYRLEPGDATFTLVRGARR